MIVARNSIYLLIFSWSINLTLAQSPDSGGRHYPSIDSINHAFLGCYPPKKAWTRCTTIFRFEWTTAVTFKRVETKWLKHFTCFLLPGVPLRSQSQFVSVLSAKAVTADGKMHPSETPSRSLRISLQELSMSLQDFLARPGPIQLELMGSDVDWWWKNLGAI